MSTAVAPAVAGDYTAERAEFLTDVLSTAVEGGIGYWSKVSAYRWHQPSLDGGTAAPYKGTMANAWTVVHELDDSEVGYKSEGVPVGLDQIESALQTVILALAGARELALAESYLKRISLASITCDAGEIDALDADIIVQIAVLGDVVYG